MQNIPVKNISTYKKLTDNLFTKTFEEIKKSIEASDLTELSLDQAKGLLASLFLRAHLKTELKEFQDLILGLTQTIVRYE